MTQHLKTDSILFYFESILLFIFYSRETKTHGVGNHAESRGRISAEERTREGRYSTAVASIHTCAVGIQATQSRL
jgi:hypothetical protein